MPRKPTYEELAKEVQALKKAVSEKHYLDRVYHSIDQAVMILNPDQTILSVNLATEKITGIKTNELIGKKCYQVFHDPDSTSPPASCPAQKSLITQNAEVAEMEVETLEGSFLVSGTPLFDAQSKLKSIIHIATDITEQKNAEKTLQRSEALLNATQQLTKIGGWEWDVEKQTMFWTDEVYRIHDFQMDEFSPGSTKHVEQSIECFDKEDRPVIKTAFKNCAEKGQAYDLEFPFTTAKGRRTWIRTLANPVLEGDRIVRVVGNIMDVTKYKRAKETQRESEENLKMIFEAADNVAFVTTDLGGKDTRVLGFSPGAEKIFGYTAKEILGRKVTILHPPDIIKAFPAMQQALYEGKKGHSGETTLVRKSGEWFPALFTLHPIFDGSGTLIGTVGVSLDITKLKQAEEALIKSETLLAETGRIGKIGGWEIDVKTLKVSWTKETYRIHDVRPGYKPTLEKAIDFFHPPDRPKLESAIQKALEHGKPYDMETRFITAKGKHLWTQAICNPVVVDGKTVKLTGTFQDITERKQAEQVAATSEKRFRELFHNNPACCFTFNRKGVIQHWNRACEKLYGWTAEQAIGKSMFELIVQKKNVSQTQKNFKALFDGKSLEAMEFEDFRADGSICHVLASAYPVMDNNGQVIYSLCAQLDITERKQAEKALRESEEKIARSRKMESLGLLAGGVAHDLNNVLSGIISYPELLLMDLPEDSKLRKPIETIKESGHRAAAIVQDLLTVARGAATTKQPLNLNDMVTDYLNSPELIKLERLHPTVNIKTNLDSGLFNVSGSHVHIRKVVMNLVSNASEAIAGSGDVTLSTTNRYIDRPLRGYEDVNMGEYAVLSVSDDGSGISSDDLERIFEPFYTKKVMGISGTGLGLAVVWNVVQDHNAYVDVTSDGNGTTFELYFPITRDEISNKDLSIPIKDYKGNKEAILVVDDVESQREITCKMLDVLGYKTKAVSSGERAVEYLKNNAVDLLLLDMIMDPGINGRETYERVIQIHPDQKAIIISGFSETNAVMEAQELGAGQYIKKPFTLETIGTAVKKELGKML